MVLGNPLEDAFGKQKFLIVFFFSLLTYSWRFRCDLWFGALAIVGKRIGADIRSIVVIIGINFALVLPWAESIGAHIGWINRRGSSSPASYGSKVGYPQVLPTLWIELQRCN
jgi:hypothetical protein